MNPKCILCDNPSTFLSENIHHKRTYFQCTVCDCAFLNPEVYLSPEEEKERYLTHNNDVEDVRYQNFVSPIVNAVLSRFSTDDIGLDFGSGTGPVISKMLKDKGYTILPYDPFFTPNDEPLKQQYNYIVSCEVIEHFHHPFKEFAQLKRLLKPDGMLICMTDLYTEDKDFDTWGYPNDPTHTIFYRPKTLEWIKDNMGFENVLIEKRLIIFFN